ncbi:MAG: hypothetical protein JWO70_1065 [Betaproteobacteria bacterium]|nr:hypothetical protein [Betaproteobacteria bacterium]
MIQRKTTSVGLAILGLAAGISFLGSNDAGAKGCNGVVNQLEWGCAAWDNNNGPEYPHYKKPDSAQPAAKTAPPAPTVAAPPAAALQPRAAAPIISTNGTGIIAQGGGNAVSKSGIIAQGGGNAVSKSGIIAQGGGNAVQNNK